MLAEQPIKIRGHHLSVIFNVFLNEDDPEFVLQDTEMNSMSYGSLFTARMTHLVRCVYQEPDLRIKIVGPESDFLCDGCFPPKKENKCFIKSVNTADYEVIMEHGLEINKVYTVDELRENYQRYQQEKGWSKERK